MLFYRRHHCHFCGTRSAHPKATPIPSFLCESCEATNYLDSRGEIRDHVPDSALSSALTSHSASTKSVPVDGTSQTQAFCNTCVHNQRVYMETLSNYLPDDEHPRYQEYVDAFPRFKADLEQRYPQVCRKCAAEAQTRIHRADYYAGTQRVGRLYRDTLRGGVQRESGARDDWGKRAMRLALRIAGMVVYASLAMQIAWHLHGALKVVMQSEAETEEVWETNTPRECMQRALLGSFDDGCHQTLGAYVPRVLLASAALFWYNPGLISYYHHTTRISSISGQPEHFRLQMILLFVRCFAYFALASSTTFASQQHRLAAHAFTMLFITVIQYLSTRAITPVPFKLNLKIMPKPGERDVLGAFAGPTAEGDLHASPKASSMHPSLLFARDRDTPPGFPIASLARPARQTRSFAPPSPPISDETDDDLDAMDIDPPNPLLSLTSTRRNGPGVARKQAQKLSYQPLEPSPFRGRLPQAPMSLERRLRNPPTQVSFKKAPVSKEQDFMSQMRDGIAAGRTYAKPERIEDEDFDSPAKARTRGQIELRGPQWQLREKDGEGATGLEDLFGGTAFGIRDDVALPTPVALPQTSSMPGWKVFGGGLAVLAIALVGGVPASRKALALWLLERIEAFGY